MAQVLLKNDLVIGVHRPAHDGHAKWMVEGQEMLLKITDDGLRAIGVEPAAMAEASTQDAPTAPTGEANAAPQAEDALAPEPAQAAPAAAARASLRDAAAAVLAAWGDPADREADIIGALAEPMHALRGALAGKLSIGAEAGPRIGVE